MRLRTVALLVAVVVAAGRPALAQTCCLGGVCELRDEAACLAAAGVPGYCLPAAPCGAPACDPASSGRGRDLFAVKAGADVRFEIEADAGADRYHTYYRIRDRNAPCPACPGSNPVPGSAPSTIPAALHLAAVPGAAGDLLFYASYAGCGETGACCASLGCWDSSTRAGCEGGGGSYQGDLTTCSTGCFCCIFRFGACCVSNVDCFMADPVGCRAQGVYLGDNTSCATASCAGTWGSCCLAGGTCVYTHADGCAARGGVFGASPTCSPNPC